MHLTVKYLFLYSKCSGKQTQLDFAWSYMDISDGKKKTKTLKWNQKNWSKNLVNQINLDVLVFQVQFNSSKI